MKQERVRRIPRARDAEQPTATTPPASAPAESKQSALTDDLLDEIDAVLEENAEEFVAAYIQKGGE